MITPAERYDHPLLHQLAALASSKRLAILQLLAGAAEPLMTCTIAQLLGSMNPSLCSRHLHELVSAGLVIRATDGQYALFALDRKAVGEFLFNINALLLAKPQDPSQELVNESL